MTNAAITTVESAYPGDFGWTWINGEWHMAYVTDNHLAVHMSPHIMEYHDLNDYTMALPWFGVPLPPGDADDKSTHHVIIKDRDMTLTVSLTLPEEMSDDFVREVRAAAMEYGK